MTGFITIQCYFVLVTNVSDMTFHDTITIQYNLGPTWDI